MKLNFLSKKNAEKKVDNNKDLDKNNNSDKEEFEYISIEDKIKRLKKRREMLLGLKVESTNITIHENPVLKKTK